jgi:acyl carrier protein
VRSHAEIENFLRNYIAEITGVPPERISATATFDRLGVDSASAVALVGDIEDWLGAEIDPTLPYEHPTIERLSRALEQLPLQKA